MMMKMKMARVEGAESRAERHHLVSLGAVAMVCLVSLLVCAMPRSAAAKPPGWSGDRGGHRASGSGHQPGAKSTGAGERGGASAGDGGGGDGAGIPAEAMASIERIMEMARAMGMEVVLDYHDDGSITVFEEGSGTGASLDARGKDIVTGFDGSAPMIIGRDGRRVQGGDASGDVRAKGPSDETKHLALLWSGIGLIVVAGAGGWFLKSVKFGVVFGGIGAGLVALSFYPGLLLFGGLGAIGVVAVYAMRSDALAGRFRESTRALVGAIDHPSVPQPVKERVAGALAMEADARDQKTIAKVRAADAALAFAGPPVAPEG